MIPVTELIGYLASILVFSTFCVKNILTLRMLAISSNLAFIIYAATSQVLPVLVLHTLLLPLNLYRVLELQKHDASMKKRFGKHPQKPGNAKGTPTQPAAVRISLCAPAMPHQALRTDLWPTNTQPVLRKVRAGFRSGI